MTQRTKRMIAPLLLTLLTLGASGCRSKTEIIDLRSEFRFARLKEHFSVLDFLGKNSDDNFNLSEGWTSITPQGTRRGIYPFSRLRFVIEDQRTYHLLLRCTPVEVTETPTHLLRIKLNGQEIKRVAMKRGMTKFLSLQLPSRMLETGSNIIEFAYTPEDLEDAANPAAKKDMRHRTLQFRELILASWPDYASIKRVLEVERNRKNTAGEELLVRVPAEIDFFLDIPPRAKFRGRFRYIPYNDTATSSSLPTFRISIEAPEGPEQTLFQVSELIINRGDEIKVEAGLPESGGPARLRLTFGGTEKSKKPAGYLACDESSITAPASSAEEDGRFQPRLSELRNALRDKNTVVVIMDSARADHFSPYGYFRPTTPDISRIAEESVLFTRAFSQGLTTRYSMSAFFTGFPPTVSSVGILGSRLPSALTTIAEFFIQKGFKTAGFTGIGQVGSFFNFHQGFDEYYELYKNDGFTHKSQEYLPYLFPWLEQNRSKRFYLYLHFKEPHAIYAPNPPFLGMFSGQYQKKVPLQDIATREVPYDPEELEYIRACYDENLASVDSAVGKILEKMKELEMLDESIVILTADHGELLGEGNNQFSHGGSFRDEGMHIPLIIRFPEEVGDRLPRRVDALVKATDVFATLADVYGFDIPKDIMEGRSLLPLLVRPDREINSFVVTEKLLGIPTYSIRTKSHKLVWTPGLNLHEFYDLVGDPAEENDIYAPDNIQAQLLLVDLRRWLDKHSILFTLLNDPSATQADMSQMDAKTEENLRALGYIK